VQSPIPRISEHIDVPNMDRTSPLATQIYLADDLSKGRRKVRVFAQDSSSSDEGVRVEPPGIDDGKCAHD
jgi:hypothetical protein